jgi:hypothetical protein
LQCGQHRSWPIPTMDFRSNEADRDPKHELRPA